jgi:1-deoxy-D-xylulose-5-phosphate reductoisomerase
MQKMNEQQYKKPVSLTSFGDGGIRRIALFGSTGSIGTQALEVIAAHPDKFSAEVLTAHSNHELLIEQALKFNPNIVVIGDEKKYNTVKEALSSTLWDMQVFALL